MFEDIFEKFHKDGFVVIENFLTIEEVDELKKELSVIIDNVPDTEKIVFRPQTNEMYRNPKFLDSADKIGFFYESGAFGSNGELIVDSHLALNKIAHALHKDNDLFRKITFDERVKEVCFQLKMEEPVIVQSMVIFKNPKIGGEAPPHQDATYLYSEPSNLVGFWIALDDASVENGCLRFARGSHKSGVHTKFVRNPDETSDDRFIYDSPAPHYQKSSFTAVPVKKGTCILIHGLVVHSSENNKSKEPRNAYTFHAMEQKNTKYSSKNWLQVKNAFMNVYKN